MYQIGNTIAVSADKINKIRNLVDFPLPEDYISFIQQYGYDISVNEFILFSVPDENYVRNNFLSYMYFWKWENKEKEEEALNSLYIAGSIDGDIICCIPSISAPYLIMSRHSESPVYTKTLNEVFDHYKTAYQIGELYLTGNHDRLYESVYMWDDHMYDPDLMNKIRHRFLSHYSPDKIFEEETVQYKINTYLFRSIGGSVYFDGGREIRISYQKPYEEEAAKIITFLKQSLMEEYNK